MTRYVDVAPSAVAARLDRAVSAGIDAAIERTSEPDAEVLRTSSFEVSGQERLSEVRISVPVNEAPSGATVLAANAFATKLARVLQAA